MSLRRLIAPSFVVLFCLGLMACAGHSETAKLLEGPWISQGVNSNGEKTRFTFSGSDKVQVDAYKRTGSEVLTSPLDTGTFEASDSTIQFSFTQLGELQSFLTVVTDNHIMIDESTFFRANPDGTIAGGTIAGQVIIADGSKEATPSAQSLMVQSGGGGGLQAMQVDGGEPDQEATTATATRTGNTATGWRRECDNKFYNCRRVKDVEEQEGIQTIQMNQENADKPKQRNYRMRLQSIEVSNDPSSWRQWDMAAINAPGGWAVVDNLNGVSDTKIGVVDTGKAINDDLSGLWHSDGYDFVDQCSDWGTPDQDYCTQGQFPGGDGNARDNNATDEGDDHFGVGQHSYHGAHVAGIMAATRDNNEGVAGVNPKAKVVALRAIGAGGWGDTYDIADAVLYAAGEINANGSQGNGTPRVKVVNLSLGCFVLNNTYSGPSSDSLYSPICGAEVAQDSFFLNEAIQAAIANGVIVVAAAGNCNEHQALCNQPFYPADYPGVIKVGGLDSNGKFATAISVYGPKQSIIAPSGGLEPSSEQAYLGAETQVFNTVKDGYAGRVGTSQAAAFVSGVASLLLSIDPSLTPAQVRQAIESTAVDLGEAGFDEVHGYGLLNVGAAAESVADNLDDVPAAELLVSSDNLNYGAVKTEKVVYAHKVGKGSVSGISADADADWVTVDVSSASAPSVITIAVDRSQLGVGDHNAQVTVSSNQGSETIDIVASKTQDASSGSTTGSGTGGGSDSFDDWMNDLDGMFGGAGYTNTVDIGDIYILLIQVLDNSVYAGIKTNFAANYQFDFSALPDGQYYVLAGQANQAGQICDTLNTPQVPCAAYPSYDTPQILTIQGGNAVTDVGLGL